MVKEKCRASGLWDSKWLSSAVDGIPFGKATPYLALSLSLSPIDIESFRSNVHKSFTG